jgi:hypothetical protein
MSRVGRAAKIEVAKLPLFAAGPTCAALDIHSAERTIGGAGLMRGALKVTRTFTPRRLSTRNLLDDYQACNIAIHALHLTAAKSRLEAQCASRDSKFREGSTTSSLAATIASSSSHRMTTATNSSCNSPTKRRGFLSSFMPTA